MLLTSKDRVDGFSITANGRGNTTLLKLDGFKPNMVIVDEVLPGGDGMEVCY